MPRTRRTYTPEFKAEAVKLVTEQGYSVAETARSLGISENLIRNWRQALEAQGKRAFPGLKGLSWGGYAPGRPTRRSRSSAWSGERQRVQDAVVEALFRAYFTEGRDISNRQTLLDVVAGAGLGRHGAEAVLNSDDGLEAIKEADALARRFGVDGVPSTPSTATE
jgi:transposase-like protein